MTRMLFTLTLLVATSVFATSAQAASISDIKRSEWDSTYSSGRGRGHRCHAQIELHGCHGHYTVHGCRADLSEITYRKLRCGRIEVEGDWEKDGQCGWFVFVVSPCGSDFRGDWGYHGKRATGYWDGDRLRSCRRGHSHTSHRSSYSGYSRSSRGSCSTRR